MNLNSHNSMNGHEWMEDAGPMDSAATGEDTLRLIAALPAPEGLEDRVRTALRTAPRQGRVLAWPWALSADAAWVRAAAAAAIVFVVAGGGWGVYSRVQPLPSGKAPAVPARVGAQSGFSGAGAVSTPKTLVPPVVSEPAKPAQADAARKKAQKKATKPQTQKPAPQQ